MKKSLNLNEITTGIILILAFAILIMLSSCANNEINRPTYTLSYQASEGGIVQGDSIQRVQEGESGTEVIAVASEGYRFVEWSDNKSTDASRIDTKVKENVYATAIFEKQQKFIVKYFTDGNGSIKGEASQTVYYGQKTSEVTAIPNEGYYFASWSDGKMQASRHEECVTSDVILKAEFRPITYRLEYNASEGGHIVGEKSQTVKAGSNGEEVMAVAEDGYVFVRWSDGLVEEIRCEKDVKTDFFVTAIFDSVFAGGDGTAGNPYMIETYEQLRNMAFYPESHYLLTNDLDLSGSKHEPIFSDSNAFNGVFDGGGKKIKNLYIETDSAFPSLFGIVDWNGIVRNVKVIRANLNAINYDTSFRNYLVGILASISAGTIENIDVEGTITASKLHYRGVAIGGLVGMAYGSVLNCKVNIKILITDVQNGGKYIEYPFNFGGLVGVGDSITVQNCSVQGRIQCTKVTSSAFEEPQVLMGGLIGYYFTIDNRQNQISNCAVAIDISGDNTMAKAAGFIGEIYVYEQSSLNVKNNSTEGTIKSLSRVGGFAYRCYSKGETEISDCSAKNKISDVSTGAGFSVYVESNSAGGCSISNCYAEGEINARSYAMGLFYFVSTTVVFRSYSVAKLNGHNAFSFAFSANECKIDQCFFEGEITTSLSGGFINIVLESSLSNCYSKGKIQIKNYVSGRILVSGFIIILRDSEIINCYSSIRITKDTNDSSFNHTIVYFVGYITASTITNCHSLSLDNAFKVIEENRNDGSMSVDITTYSDEEEMYFLADILNTGESVVWVNRKNDSPSLFYI